MAWVAVLLTLTETGRIRVMSKYVCVRERDRERERGGEERRERHL